MTAKYFKKSLHLFSNLFRDMRQLRFTILFFLFSLLSFSLFAKLENDRPENDGIVDNSIIIARINNDDIEVSIPLVIFSFSDAEIKLKFKNPQHTRLLLNKNKINFIINGEEKQLDFVNGEASFKKKFDNDKVLTIFIEEFSYNHNLTVFSIWSIILPIAAIIALIILMMMKRK